VAGFSGSMAIILDTESRSRRPLKPGGGRKYWQHASSEILCLAWKRAETRDPIRLWHPGDPRPREWGDEELAAHNMSSFDRFALEAYDLVRKSPLVDTSHWAKRMGLSGSLEHSALALTSIRKDKAERRHTVGLSSVRRPTGKGRMPKISAEDWKLLDKIEKGERGEQVELTPEKLRRSDKYCVSDVRVMDQAFPHWVQWRHIDEPARKLDQTMNDRGIAFDDTLARALLDCIELNTELKMREVGKIVGMPAAKVRKIVNSSSQLADALGVKNVQKKTLEKCTHPLADARRALNPVVKGKLLAGLARQEDDGVLRDNLVYIGAGPWRWTSVGVQLHNQKRPHKMFEDWTNADICRLAERVGSGLHYANNLEIDLLLRACLIARPGNRFVGRDFSGVESKALAYCANDTKALELIRSGGDPYVAAAAVAFGVRYGDVTKDQRQFGKMLDLACQYGLGWETFRDKLIEASIDYKRLRIDPEAAVNAWRKLRAPTVRYWKMLENAFYAAIDGRRTMAGPFEFCPADNGRDIAMFMPNGRPLVYRNARIVQEKKYFKKEKAWRIASSLAYDGRLDHPKRRDIHGELFDGVYGGLLAQNAMESLCREILVHAMLEGERRGLPMVLSVHDEALAEVHRTEVKDAAREMQDVMTTVPWFVKGFPLFASGFEGERFQK